MEKLIPNTNRENVAHEEVFKSDHEKIVMLQAYEKAQEILEKESIKPEQFEDTYSEKLLTKCATYVANCESLFEQSNESNPTWMRAEIFGKTLEGLLHNQINNGVFGEDVRGVSTAKYDDIYAGIDQVIERRNEEGASYVGCALDATFGSPEKKIDDIHNGIKAGVLNDVIFYDSPFGDPPYIHGKLQGIPKMVIGMDSQHLTQLSELWVINDQESLAKNQLFLMLLRQIEQQAEVYEILATRAHKPNIADRYRQVGNSISKLYNEQKIEKGVDMLDSETLQDSVNQAIIKQLHELLNPK